MTKRRMYLLATVSSMGISIVSLAGIVWAATNQFRSTEVESAALSGNVTSIDDPSASINKAVKFGSAASPVVPASTPGWEINENNIGLAPFGLSCASLPLYTGPSNVPANTTIYRQRINKTLTTSAGGITIDQSCIQPTTVTQFRGIVDARDLISCPDADTACVMPNQGPTIRDSEIDASQVPVSQIGTICATMGNGTYIRNYMHGMGSGICIYGTGTNSSGWIQQNYVTDLRSYGDSHNESATVRDLVRNAGDTRKVTFIGNRMFCDGNVTATIFFQPTWEDVYNVWIQDNFFDGGGFNIYSAGGQTGAHLGNMHSINNRVRSTGWGPASVLNVEGWDEWRDNYRYAPGNPDAKGALIPDPS